MSLETRKSEIIEIWKSRLREECEGARRITSEPALLDDVPRFLDQLAHLLNPRSPSPKFHETTRIARHHGRDRARKQFNLNEVMREWIILLQVIFATLEKNGPINPSDRDLILETVHHSMSTAVSEFIESTTQFREQAALTLEPSRIIKGLVSFSIVALATIIQWLIWPLIDPAYFLLYYPAIMVAAFYGDGLWALFLSVAAIQFLFAPPLFPFDLHSSGELITMTIFILVSLIVIHLTKSLHASRRKSAAAYQEQLADKKNLQQALEDIQEERQLRERFVTTLSHDLRNPLSSIKANIELSADRRIKLEDRQQLVRRAIQSIDRANQMIQDLLNANRIQAGQPLTYEMLQMDLRRLAQDILEDFAARYGDRFTLVCESSCMGIWNRTALQRLIENILQNAVKYSSQNSPITLWIKRNSTQTQISVHNFGSYIAEHEKKHLFEPYQRLDSQKHTTGWGIGLAIVRGIIEAHHGSITVESTPESGTSFIVTLPNDSRETLTQAAA